MPTHTVQKNLCALLFSEPHLCTLMNTFICTVLMDAALGLGFFVRVNSYCGNHGADYMDNSFNLLSG